MIDIYFKTVRDKKFKKIDSFRAGGWINITNATDDDLMKVSELTGLEFADVQDSLDMYEIPRVERQEKKNVLFYVRNPSKNSESVLQTELLTIIISEKYLITISSSNNSIIQGMLSASSKLATTQKSKLLINILLKVSQAYTREIKSIRNRLLSDRKQVKIETEDFISLSATEDTLNQYISSLVPMNNVIEAIRSGKYISLYAEDEDSIQDLLIAGKQSVDICTVNLKALTSVRESYQVIFTNNLNKVIRLLTALTIILTIPTIIASFYGMNVTIPLSENPNAFFVVLSVTIAISLGVLLIFSVKKWL